MKRKNIAELIVCCLLFGIVAFAGGCAHVATKADAVNIATLNWPPYVDPAQADGGAGTQIVTTALKKAGYEPKIHYIQWKDAITQTAEGKYDGVYPAYFSEERFKKYLVSEPFMAGQVVLCTRQSIKYDSLESLKPYRIGTVAGYVNSKAFDDASFLNKVVGKSDSSNLVRLMRGDLDIVVIDRMVGIYLIDKNRNVLGSSSGYMFLDPPLGTRDCYLMLPRCLPQSVERQQKFDAAIRDMRKKGTIEKIIRNHGFK